MARGSGEHRGSTDVRLTQAQERFIAQWGQMGSTWGISRTMAEIHALLYIAGTPLNTDDVMERLRISRGNASMSLRALCEWAIVSKVHKRGDRKEYFQADRDVWALCRKIIRERLRRDIHPLLAALYEIRDLTEGGPSAPGIPEHNERLDDLLDLIQKIDTLGERFVGSEEGGGGGIRLAVSLLTKFPQRHGGRQGKSDATKVAEGNPGGDA